MTSMAFAKVRRTAEARLTYTVTGADDRPVPGYYARLAAWYRPETVELYYRMTDHHPGARIQVTFADVTVRGHKIKKDGNPGQMPASEHFHHDRLDKAPQWLRELLASAEALMQAADAVRETGAL